MRREDADTSKALTSLICLKTGLKLVTMFPLPYQRGQKLIPGNNYTPYSAHQWHLKNLWNKLY